MFQSFRNQKRWLMLIAMILIIPAFVFIGINGYSRLNPDANAIAKVDGKGIQPEEFDYQKREYIERMRQQEGGAVDPSIFETQEANAAILQNIATRRALQAQMAHHYMNVSEADAINVIKNADAFKKDGQFSPELYENYLAARGKSDQQFVYELRRDLVQDMLVNSVAQTTFVPKKTVALLNDILRETRVVRTMSFDPSSYMKDVKVSEEQIKKYYDEHKDDYRAPESLNIQFVVMSPETVKMTAEPSEQELKDFYEQNRKKYEVEESRRAAHILIAPDANEADKAKADQDAKAKAEKILALNNPMMQFCLYVVMIFVLTFGSYLVVNFGGAIIQVGQLSSLLTYSLQILMSLMMVSMIFVMVTISIESCERIVAVLEEKRTISNPENPIYEVNDGSIDFNNVSFKYSKRADRYALENINLHIKSGQTIGILGGTGSSKTSLVNLISRLYDVTEGEVKVGGVNVKDYDLVTLRDAVSVVLQKNVLFSGSIKENLRWGNKDATDEEIEEACHLACADEFIEQFPDKYDTHIEQGGTNVSGGQKQRLCIARALLKKPKILILDDSTSAVDTKTDAIIRAGFKKFIPETTKIIIAQRVSSVQDADQIIIMNNGSIEAVGTHDELLASNPIYQEVYYSQNKGGEQDEK